MHCFHHIVKLILFVILLLNARHLSSQKFNLSGKEDKISLHQNYWLKIVTNDKLSHNDKLPLVTISIGYYEALSVIIFKDFSMDKLT